MARSHVIEDQIVIDGLQAICEIDSGYRFYIGGGTAVQAQVPSRYHRRTSDIDSTFGRPLNNQGFKELVAPFIAYLTEKGYECETEKNRQHFDVVYAQEDESHLFQVSRRSSANFERNRAEISRELERVVQRLCAGVELPLLSPEDLILHKSRRVCVFEDRYGLSALRKYSSHDEQFDYLMRERKRLERSFDNATPEEIAEFRLQADLFDIGLLLDYAEFDEQYYREWAAKEPIFKRNLDKSKKIVRSIDERLEF
ncbi:hypothetical protein D6774_01690 [Candidatus Woesearchaeota archaeon]|nr:MAG: hypothetical protein D6774_01690 [Candidatus Woesearchaeota archaeon]